MATTPRKAPVKRPKAAVGTKKASGTAAGTHIEKEDFPWAINIPAHDPRKDSPLFVTARKTMINIVSQLGEFPLSPGSRKAAEGNWQDHHGGGLWLMDDDGWFFVKNLAGMEWSQRFCADPAKVDALRVNAVRLYKAFPKSIPALKKAGFAQAQKILATKITDAEGIATWCDSIFNASVPLFQDRHTGSIAAMSKSKGKTKPAKKGAALDPALVQGGVHHYPTPITDIQIFKHDDFQLWVLDNEGHPAAVVPASARGSGDSKVVVQHATPGTKLHKQLASARAKNKPLVLSGRHPMAKQAFAKQ